MGGRRGQMAIARAGQKIGVRQLTNALQVTIVYPPKEAQMRRSLIPAVLLLCITIPPARAQQAAEPTPEQTITALRNQWLALFVASVVNARAHGQSAAEFGTSIGRTFSPSWPKDLTPQGLARGMQFNIRLIGLEAELLEDTPEQAVVRFSRPDSAQFSTRYGTYGATVADYDAALKAVLRQIAVDHGLVWDQRADGSQLTAKVTRKR